MRNLLLTAMMMILVSHCLIETLAIPSKDKDADIDRRKKMGVADSKKHDKQSKAVGSLGRRQDEEDGAEGENGEEEDVPMNKQKKPKESFDWKTIEKFLRQMHKWVKAKAAEQKDSEEKTIPSPKGNGAKKPPSKKPKKSNKKPTTHRPPPEED